MNIKKPKMKLTVSGDLPEVRSDGFFSLVLLDAIIGITGLEFLGDEGLTPLDFMGLEICQADSAETFKASIIAQFREMCVTSVRFNESSEMQIEFGQGNMVVVWVDIIGDRPTEAKRIVEEAVASMHEIEIVRDDMPPGKS